MNNYDTTGIIILAAGASVRLGMPKQNLFYNGKTLLQIAADAALETECDNKCDNKCDNLIIVLGANAETALPYLQNKPVTIVQNALWRQGMASSIHAGLSALIQKNNAVAAVIIMLCDQPFADAGLLIKLIAQKAQTGKGIIASAYAETIGVPALFDKKYFAELLMLQGEEGAKKIVLKCKEDTAFVPFEKGIIDIDTMKDYEALKAE